MSKGKTRASAQDLGVAGMFGVQEVSTRVELFTGLGIWPLKGARERGTAGGEPK